MSAGAIFLAISAALFFLLMVGKALFPGHEACALLCLVLGLLLGGYRLPGRQQG